MHILLLLLSSSIKSLFRPNRPDQVLHYKLVELAIDGTPSVLLWCNGRAEWRSWKVGCMTAEHFSYSRTLKLKCLMLVPLKGCQLWKALNISVWRVERKIIFGSRWADVIDADFPAQHFQNSDESIGNWQQQQKMNFIWNHQVFISTSNSIRTM